MGKGGAPLKPTWPWMGKPYVARRANARPISRWSINWAASEVATGIVLATCVVQHKENEISALDHLLTPALVNRRIISADAMHTRAPLL